MELIQRDLAFWIILVCIIVLALVAGEFWARKSVEK